MILGQPPGEPSLVVSQPWYEKEGRVDNGEIQHYLSSSGFREIPGSYFGWFRPADGVVLVDAKPDNFIKTAAGLVPIDLQMAHFTNQQLDEAGLKQ